MAADVPDQRPESPLAAGRMPRRPTDRVEDAAAWLLTSAAFLVAIAAVLMGTSEAARGDERVRAEARDRVPLRVVLLEAALPAPAPDGYSLPQPVDVAARWTLPDGSERLAPVTTSVRAPAGSELTRWVDRLGRPVAAPRQVSSVLLDAVLRAVVVALCGGLAIVTTWRGVRRFTAARNAIRWERDWRRIEPRWSGRPPWR